MEEVKHAGSQSGCYRIEPKLHYMKYKRKAIMKSVAFTVRCVSLMVFPIMLSQPLTGLIKDTLVPSSYVMIRQWPLGFPALPEYR